MGLLDAFIQYVKDAAPGGLLNAETKPIADRVNYIGGLLDNNSQISQDAQNWHKRTQKGLADQLAGRESPDAEYAYGSMMNAAGMAPVGILRNAAMDSAAKAHFGKTFNPAETGFLLDDATRLDLSGRHYASGYENVGGKYVPKAGQPDYLRGNRAVDHRELGDLVNEGGWGGLSDFMNQTGAVRYMPDVGISTVNTNMPSRAQIEKAVQDFRRAGNPMNVDVDPLNGNSAAVSQEFARPTVDAVLEFLQKNMKPDAFK